MGTNEMKSFEKLGAFYLGKRFDEGAQAVSDELLLYDAKDLTTHAVCVGMTGSGKTGLCVSLLEEAAIDGIPAIAVDPKGDLGNLLLTFPELRPADFRPWIDEAEATRSGRTLDEYAADRAALWKKGLADWGQDGSRIARLRAAADLAIYTPGSSAGLQLSLLKSFAAPPAALAEDADAFRERVTATVSGLMALLGLDADPIRSREHILLSNIIEHEWRRSKDLDLPSLIQRIQSPPFDRVGVMDVDSFFPGADRFALSMSLNNLLASPGFAGWMEGDPLNVPRLLWTPEGRPRIAVLSIAGLSEAERMFFVTILLNEVLSWMRTQPGTSSLRALLYMDEIFGYFPPSANPPSKTPMLTLLKQARAYGLGIVLATQNPVDLDYKGLSNTGTWFLGRLQTERDKARVLDGLEGASAAAGAGFDRSRTETTLSGLKSRVFLMNNVHDDEPTLFHTRWALSFLRGPLTRTQIRALTAARQPAPSEPAAASSSMTAPASSAAGADPGSAASDRPVVPADASEMFLPRRGPLSEGDRLVYRPALLASAKLHFVRSSGAVDTWKEISLLAPLAGDEPDEIWENAEMASVPRAELDNEPEPSARFSELPGPATRAGSYSAWGKALAGHLYRNETLDLWKCREPKASSRPHETEGEFRARLTQLAREQRDLLIARLEKRYAPKLARVKERIRRAEQRVEKERSQYGQQKVQTAISVGATVLGALFGRRIASVGTVGRASTAARGVGRAARERADIERAQSDLEVQNRALLDLEAEFNEEAAAIRESADPADVALERVQIRPRKSDIVVDRPALVWLPWRVDSDGIAEPAFDRRGSRC